MININKNSQNVVVLTLTEKTTLTNPYYLFSFINGNTREVTNFISTDLSTYKSRYNEFLITETGTTFVNLTGGTINLKTGMYSYTIHQQTSPTNLIVSAATSVVEVGKVIVVGDDNAVPEVYK
jgi:hypothetical protein